MAGVVKQLAGGGGGQSLKDRVTAAKHSISGAGLAKAVCKATTEELMAPKKKHLQYLIECTNESNVSIPELANELLERLKHQTWVVTFKSLISMHNLMNYGNERFTQYLASNNCNFALVNFSDKSSVQGADMSRFICRYSAYIQERAIAYRMMAFDFCKVKRGTEDGALRTMPADKILKALSVLIVQFDSLLGFDATANELTNAVISAAFVLLYKDASRLFVVFNDGIINLLSKFFEAMNKKQCREALEIYKKFIARSQRLSEFSQVAEYAGIERADVTRLEKHPASFLDAMESHLAHLEGRRVPRSGSSNSIGSGPAGAAAVPASEPPKLSQLLMEEQQQLDRLKAEQVQRKATAAAAAAAAAKATPTVPAASAGFDDLLLAGPRAQHRPTVPQQPQQQQPTFFTNFPPSNAPAPSNGFDPFGTVLQPISANQSAPGNLAAAASMDTKAANNSNSGKSSGLTGDLDSSLASLVGNLNIRQGQFGKQSMNWAGTAQSTASSSALAAASQQQASTAPRPAVKIAAGPTVNWSQPSQQQYQAPAGYPAASYAYSGGAQQLGFLHTQSQPAFRVSPTGQQQQQPQQPSSVGWSQQPNSSDPFGAL